MRDYEEILKSMRICLNVDIDSNCLSECFGCAYIDHDHHIMDMVRDAADAIEELLAAVPEWISVEDVLPDEWREVLTYSPIHSDEKNPHMIQLCWYIGFGKWRECQYGEIVEIPITHWMPLPAPPKEEELNKNVE